MPCKQDRPPENKMRTIVRGLLSMALLLFLPALAAAQSLPVSVTVSGNTANVRIGAVGAVVADMTLSFDDASGLSPAALGISAETINLSSAALLARLPAGSLTSIPSSLPLMITVEPPTLGGLSQRRLVHVEVHTHALAYSAGSPFRLFKAQLGGPFRDITESVLPGSVRTRGTTPGWSQFILVADLRPTRTVIAEKIAYLRAQLDFLSATEADPLRAYLAIAEQAVADSRFADASVALDSFTARVSARAGSTIPDLWRAARDTRNSAGELLAGANTLAFSIGYLRDFGN
jgi:hypothetical protein